MAGYKIHSYLIQPKEESMLNGIIIYKIPLYNLFICINILNYEINPQIIKKVKYLIKLID